jgi:uncharacterized SAM-binding protein YcdF (DUF218 family)
MFFILSKTAGFFAEPSNLLITLGIVGVLLTWWRFARLGPGLMATSIVMLTICAFSPLGQALILPLEQRFPVWRETAGPPDGIVVLGGAIDELVSAARGQPSLSEAAERVTVVARLARDYPQARIVFTGGSGRLFAVDRSEASVAENFFAEIGVPAGRVMFEDKSRNTIENALFSKELAKPQPGERWLLVTSAFHMPRSVGIFRRAEFPVEAYPVDFRTRGSADLLRPFDRASEGLRRLDVAGREWAGLLIYWLAGHTSELLPGPR